MIPIMEKCNEAGIPIILESNMPEYTSIYEHFGFNLVKIISHVDFPISQFCFIKYPDSQ